MKFRGLRLLMAVILIMQTISFTQVFANSASTDRVVFDFSDSNAVYNVTGGVDGINDYEIVKGQYGKAKDDASFRLYSLGGEAAEHGADKSLTLDTSSMTAAGDGEYTHLSFQLLNEDGYSVMYVEADYIASDGSEQTNKKVHYQYSSSSNMQENRLLYKYGNAGRSNSTHRTWQKFDIYFAPTGEATTFINGVRKYQGSVAGWSENDDSDKDIVKNIRSLEFRQQLSTVSPFKASAIQIDDIIVEKVNSVPESTTHYGVGESFVFDDNINPNIKQGYYVNYTYISSKATQTAEKRVSTAFYFYSTTNHQLETGVFGRPAFDKSVHTQVPQDAGGIGASIRYYQDKIVINPGDYAHISFSIANNSDGQIQTSLVDFKTASDGINTKCMIDMNGDSKIYMFDADTGATWEKQKWYNFDVILKVGNGTDYTKADCYIDGVKYLSDISLDVAKDGSPDYSPLKTFGRIQFPYEGGNDYYVDDLSFYVHDENTFHNPEDGYLLDVSSASEDIEIDDTNHIINIVSDVNFTSYSDLFADSDYVTVYTKDGLRLPKGTLTANNLVKVTNGYGAGIFYKVESAGIMTEASLFDIADGSVVVVKDTNTLNACASGEADEVIKLDIYADEKLLKTVNSDETSINLDELMLGRHSFKAYAYINDTDCYTDFIDLTLVEEKENVVLSKNTLEDYTTGSSTISGGKIIQTGGRAVSEEVVDSEGISYGKSLVLEGTKERYLASGKQELYMDIYTPEANSIKKALMEFDICLLDDVAATTLYRGKEDLSSTDNKAANFKTGDIGTTTKFGGSTVAKLSKNKWYHIKSLTDVKNGVFSLWVDDTPIVENYSITSSPVLISSEMRIQFKLPDGAYDTVDTIRYAAFDNFELKEYDELAYIDSVKDSSDSSTVDYTEDTLTVKMSETIDNVAADNLKLYSTNGERPIKSVTIDENDASILYVTPKYKLSSSDTYSLVIDSGLKSAAGISTKNNCGIFNTSAKELDVLQGDFEVGIDGTISFKTKISNKTSSDKDLIIISYVYEGDEFKGIASKTVTVKAGKKLTDSVDLPYYSSTAKVYGLVTDNWTTLKPITNKLYSHSY